MRLLQLSLDTPSENIALDEALLEEAESSGSPSEWLRLWESAQPAVVVGRGSHLASEVNVDSCEHDGVAILRRSSGGGAVVIGPGCLLYSLVLSYELRPTLRAIDHAHAFVLGVTARTLARLVQGAQCAGTSDLAIDKRKFSGNSMRCRRTHFLYHGTILYNMPLVWISRYLLAPPREPAYRAGRLHEQFVRHFSAPATEIRKAIIDAWQPHQIAVAWPREKMLEMEKAKFSQPAWTNSGRVDH